MMVDFHDAGNVGHLHGEGTTGFNLRTFDINGKYDGGKYLTGITTANYKLASDVGLIYSWTPQGMARDVEVRGLERSKGSC